MVQSIKKWPTMYSHHAFLYLKDSKCIQISCIWTCQGENVYEDSYMFTIYRRKKTNSKYTHGCVCVPHMALFMNYCVAVYSDKLKFVLSHSIEF